MKKKYILLLLLGFFGMNISAQTLTQAKALYEKGQYDQAKPALKNSSNHSLTTEVIICGMACAV